MGLFSCCRRSKVMDDPELMPCEPAPKPITSSNHGALFFYPQPSYIQRYNQLVQHYCQENDLVWQHQLRLNKLLDLSRKELAQIMPLVSEKLLEAAKHDWYEPVIQCLSQILTLLMMIRQGDCPDEHFESMIKSIRDAQEQPKVMRELGRVIMTLQPSLDACQQSLTMLNETAVAIARATR